MNSISELLAYLYPSELAVDIEARALQCEAQAIDYDTRGWKEVTRGQLLDEAVQLNLVRTFYQSQWGYSGVVAEILQSLEDWSGGDLEFDILDGSTQEFYERLYAFMGFTHFEHLNRIRQVYLLGGRFLMLALLWDIEVFSALQRYFARSCFLSSLRSDAMLFTKAIEQNATSLDENSSDATVSTLVEQYNEYIPSGADKKIGEFYRDKIVATALGDATKQALGDLVEVYDHLATNRIWREVSYSACAHEKLTSAETFDPDAYYLHLLEQASDLKPWLEDHTQVVPWLAQKSDSFKYNLFELLSTKINLDEEENAQLLLQFVSELQDTGVNVEGVVYFNEQAGKFEWDLASLKQIDTP